MKVVVDTNILFSAAISPNSQIADLLLNPAYALQRFSCYYTFIELFKHKEKIMKLAKQDEESVLHLLYSIMRKLELQNEDLIAATHWQEAYELTKDVDNKDIAFVALCLNLFDSYLWTGDKKLYRHLKANGFERVILTSELVAMLGV